MKVQEQFKARTRFPSSPRKRNVLGKGRRFPYETPSVASWNLQEIFQKNAKLIRNWTLPTPNELTDISREDAAAA